MEKNGARPNTKQTNPNKEDYKFKFKKLTPAKIDKSKMFTTAMNFAFSESDVNNIAITGPYGSGKSTMINSYIDGTKDKKFISVSLAHFGNGDKKVVVTDAGNKQEQQKNAIRDLEANVINQLIHQIDPKKIPQSRFNVKKEVSKRNSICNAVKVLLFICTGYYLFFHEEWGDLNVWAKYIALTLFVFLLWHFIYKIIRFQHNTNFFKQMSFKDLSIALFKEEDSIFEKYTGEIIYMLANSGSDAIVFEDIDRFDQKMVFEHLRQINMLLNSEEVKKRREGEGEIKFFYLIKDDVFSNKDRTKFFDFIIPIVPYIDSSNSYDRLRELVKEAGWHEKIGDDFIFSVSLYLDDMRIINNICNEFAIYSALINNTGLEYKNLFAMIVYKNLFPKDFAQLHFRKGYLFSLFAQKSKIVRRESENLFEQKAEILINVATDFKLYNPLENKVNEDEVIEVLADYRERHGEALPEEISLMNIQTNVDRVKNKLLRELIKSEDFDVLGYEKITDNEYFSVIKMFVYKGYIDETYSDYMSFFYDTVFKKEDKKFLRDVMSRNGDLRDYKVLTPDLVISRLGGHVFSSEHILNYDILDELLSDEKYSDKLIKFIMQIAQMKDVNFVDIYLAKGKSGTLVKFVDMLNEFWDDVFRYLLDKEKGISTKNKDMFVELTIAREILLFKNETECKYLCDYINSNTSLLGKMKVTEKKELNYVISNLKTVGVEFDILSEEDTNSILLTQIGRESLYKITLSNIKIVMNKLYGYTDFDKNKNHLYTVLSSGKYVEVFKYINDDKNINKFVDALLTEHSGSFTDKEESALALINRENVAVENRKEYLKRWVHCCRKLTDIKQTEFWELALNKEKVAYTVENVMEYFLHVKKLDDKLTTFINLDKSILNFRGYGYGDKISENFVNNVFTAPKLSDKKFEEIITGIDYFPENFKEANLSKARISILIKHKKIIMSKANFDYILNDYRSILTEFVQKNSSEFFSMLETKEIKLKISSNSTRLLDSLVELDIINSFDVGADDVYIINHKKKQKSNNIS